MGSNRSQVINSVLIIVGAALLIFHIAVEKKNPYVMVVGLVLLMFGLYRATNHWVITKDDHKEDDGTDKDKFN